VRWEWPRLRLVCGQDRRQSPRDSGVCMLDSNFSCRQKILSSSEAPQTPTLFSTPPSARLEARRTSRRRCRCGLLLDQQLRH